MKFFILFLCLSLPALAGGDGVVPTKTVVVTAYCNCKKCVGKWSKFKRTSSGTRPKQGRTIACNFFPPGTALLIESVGIRIVEDKLPLRYASRIDVFFNSHQDALEFGKQELKVSVWTPLK